MRLAKCYCSGNIAVTNRWKRIRSGSCRKFICTNIRLWHNSFPMFETNKSSVQAHQVIVCKRSSVVTFIYTVVLMPVSPLTGSSCTTVVPVWLQHLYGCIPIRLTGSKVPSRFTITLLNHLCVHGIVLYLRYCMLPLFHQCTYEFHPWTQEHCPCYHHHRATEHKADATRASAVIFKIECFFHNIDVYDLLLLDLCREIFHAMR